MKTETFRAMVVEEREDKTFVRAIRERTVGDLPEGDILIKVRYSSLNYKDALSASGNKGVTRKYPHTPGVDAAGVVVESTDTRFKPGAEVVVTGYDLGMNTDGGFGQYIRVPADWVVPLPVNLTPQESMVYGTAGFTAALSVFRLQELDLTPEKGEILVTGATGGVGSIAVSILSKLGYRVVAATGKETEEAYLRDLGAAEVIPRQEVLDTSGRPLLKGRWAGVVDTVGGEILATAIKSAQLHAVITTCGNVGGAELPITVYPFILRGASLLGVDSAGCPMAKRLQVWDKISGEWKLKNLDRLSTEISLDELDGNIDRILQGKQTGRKVVNLSK
jgi:putative YhdH/YhfP family quinone oxidoreductase